jgi:hypothetical protein
MTKIELKPKVEGETIVTGSVDIDYQCNVIGWNVWREPIDKKNVSRIGSIRNP